MMRLMRPAGSSERDLSRDSPPWQKHPGIDQAPSDCGVGSAEASGDAGGRKEWAGDRWREHGLVFTCTVGTGLDSTNVTHRFQRILKAAGLPKSRFHDLRHTAASFLLVQGCHPRLVMEVRRHSQIALTMNTYSHVIPAMRDEAADKMDAILKPRFKARGYPCGYLKGREQRLIDP